MSLECFSLHAESIDSPKPQIKYVGYVPNICQVQHIAVQKNIYVKGQLWFFSTLTHVLECI